MFTLFTSTKLALRRTPFFSAYFTFKANQSYRSWIAAGKPLPPPGFVKQRIIKEYASRYGTPIFVETGTYLGDTVFAMLPAFESIHSIELDSGLFQNAQKRFAGIQKVHLHQGDSGQVLGTFLKDINEPCLFWLDGHYSAGITAKGMVETPIIQELEHIQQHPKAAQHIILIDDARCFTGANDYPTIDYLSKWASQAGYQVFAVEDDIIRIHN